MRRKHVRQLELPSHGLVHSPLARAFLSAAALYESGDLDRVLRDRYAGWDGDLGRHIMAGASLDDLAGVVHGQNLDPKQRSGHQERLENIVNRFA